MSNRFLRYSIIALIVLVGCTREDLSECKVDLRIQHYYTLNPANTDLFDQQVNKTAVYIFDHNNKFYDYKLVDNSELDSDNAFTVALHKGQYTIVSWAGEPQWYNLGETSGGASTFVNGLRSGITPLSDFRLWVPNNATIGGDTIEVTKPSDLFHGKAENVTVTGNQGEVIPIGLIKNTHNIHVTIKGLSVLSPDPQGAINFYAVGNNSFYRHNNTFDLSAGKIKYLPHLENTSNDQMTSDIKVLRLMPSHPLMLTVADQLSGHKYYEFDLIPYIMQSPSYQNQQDLDREDLFDVEIKVGMNVNITLIINGWQITNVTPILP